MRSQATIQILGTVKKLLREKKLSYADLAKPLGLSHSSVKRLMSSDEISFGRLVIIADLLGMDLQEVLQTHADQDEGLFKFTEKQEQFFAKAPHFLAFLYELASGLSPLQIEKKWELSKRSIKKYLNELESLGLIHQTADQRVNLKFKGTFSWEDSGTLGMAFSKSRILDFSRHVVESLGLPNAMTLEFSSWILTERNYLDLQNELKTLSKKYRQLSRFNAKALTREQIQRYTFVAMVDRWYKAPYRTVVEI